MTIICIEGASSVGKSTTCKTFAARYNAYVVPETAFLFDKPQLEGKDLMLWLMERQVDRWKLAKEKSKEFEYVILDGDIFKIWYDWVYGFESMTLEETASYFREKLLNQEISFPDAYIVLWIEEEELRMRKHSDYTKTRRNFDKHLRLIEPQLKYFTYMSSIMPHSVGIYKANDVEDNVQHIAKQSEMVYGARKDEISIFEKMIDFYRNNTP
ncbi:AAA family ATPase [Paenibacillus agilis]|uniref:Chloramphenicol acetyltransferase n=1 Tax=Paenibacillus agilis TaxID=3020863 RepID=A0A559IYF4_9BACL|nr:AAA family ATPase [Paenibacillus agilis]TVX92659.1 chloramphenicol acetyltransferase [Paenibacillus agilis]